MTDQHPITPPPELVEQWCSETEYATPGRVALHTISEQRLFQLLTRSAQWGYEQVNEAELQQARDEELEACCDWLSTQSITDALCDYDLKPIADDLRAARRPKPPSLNKQALEALDEAIFMADDDPPEGICSDQADIIRRALERLKQLEDSND